MGEKKRTAVPEFSEGLKKIRQRRWLLWIIILAYVPAMMLALQSAGLVYIGRYA